MFDTLTTWSTQLLTAGGSAALALVMLVENLFPPIPSEVVLPLAGFLVGQGDLGAVQALVAATVGSVVGALILYALGRFGGLPLLLRYRHVLRLSEEDIRRADAWFDRHGPKIVFFARMVPLARSVVSVPAGTSEMPLGRFMMLTTAGSLLWNALLIGAGYLLGSNWHRVSDVVGPLSTVVRLVFVAGLLAATAWWWRARRRRPARR